MEKQTYLYNDKEAEMMFEATSFKRATNSVISSLKQECKEGSWAKDYLKRFKKNPEKYLKILIKQQLTNIQKNYENLKS